MASLPCEKIKVLLQNARQPVDEPGNEIVPNIPLDHLENKRQVMATLAER